MGTSSSRSFRSTDPKGSRHKTSDSNKSKATTTPTEQKKSKFDIFLKSWRAEIGESTDKFDNLNSKEQNIIQDIYQNLTKEDISKKIYNRVIDGYSELELFITHFRYEDIIEKWEFEMLVIFILKQQCSFMKGMKFYFNNRYRNKKSVTISWHHQHVREKDIIRCRGYVDPEKSMKWSHVKNAKDILIFYRLIQLKRKELSETRIVTYKKITGEKLPTNHGLVKWNSVIPPFTYDDDVDFKNLKCADKCDVDTHYPIDDDSSSDSSSW